MALRRLHNRVDGIDFYLPAKADMNIVVHPSMAGAQSRLAFCGQAANEPAPAPVGSARFDDAAEEPLLRWLAAARNWLSALFVANP